MLNLKPPYYAVIFTSLLNEQVEYEEMSAQMVELAKQQPGFLGIESAREKIGITVSYWDSLEAIKNWKTNTDHLLAQQKGIALFYKEYAVKICKVERGYHFLK